MPSLSEKIQELSAALKIDKIGFVPLSEPIDEQTKAYYQQWISSGMNADMTYLNDHALLRQDPRLLLEAATARSVIVCAVSYYPTQLQPHDAPQVSKYAYGRDYHKVLRKLLSTLAERIHTEITPHHYRVCVDTAPVLERYWAERAGLGHIGKNKNLIIPKIGSYLFIGEIITSLDIDIKQSTLLSRCGSCTRCIDACPTSALTLKGLDARRCLSYLTIEHKGDFPDGIAALLDNRIYGCDTCQDVCPYNHSPAPTQHFPAHPQILSLTSDDLAPFTEERYARLFYGSAVVRAKYEGMKRNIRTYFSNNDLMGLDTDSHIKTL